jgi:hypothetical protein
MSVTTDRYVYPLTGVVVVTVTITNIQIYTLSGLSISSTVYDSANRSVLVLPLVPGKEVGPLTTATFNVSASYSLSDENYVIVSNAMANGTEVGSANVPFVVLDTSGKAPLTLALVFHMHQPIYLNLQGQFEQPWVQVAWVHR